MTILFLINKNKIVIFSFFLFFIIALFSINPPDLIKKKTLNVYYDIVDLSDSSKTTTNLYGILLLDNVTPTTDGGYIQRYPKYKPNRVTGQNGNSYGFKII